jgi:glycosyltransferase involved in cell wall biosynthesis
MVAPQPFFRARGTPFSVLHRIRVLVEAGHRVDLVTYPFGEDVELPGLAILRCQPPPLVRDVRIGPALAKLALDVPLYFTTVRALGAARYDVLHSHEEAAFFAVGLARRHGLLHVYDMHSSLPQQLGNFGAYDLRPVRKVFAWLERRVLRSCDGVITICRELADIATPLCGDTPHAMIENTADDRKVFGSRPADAIRSLPGLAGRRLILYTGTFEPYQGLDLLLGAFARVHGEYPQAHLLLAGGRPEQIALYRRQASQLGIADAVTFAGTVHPGQIPGLTDAAELIVSPRCAGTNTPLKLYGYLRSGRPLVATNLLTHTPTLDETIARLVPPSVEGLAAGLRELLADPELGRTLAAAARARARERFSDAAYARKVLALYDAVIADRADATRSVAVIQRLEKAGPAP